MVLCGSGLYAGAQTQGEEPAEPVLSLAQIEDSLVVWVDSMLDAEDLLVRQNSCYRVIRGLVRALRQPGSFAYRFDRLRRISILYPEDGVFRLFTWALRLEGGTYRYYGCIQMNQPELVLYPLFDARAELHRLADTITNHQRWPGALYYNLKTVSNSAGSKRYYVLFGWDGYTATSSRKLIEVLTFVKGKPVFGAPIFDFGRGDPRNKWKRFIIEYKEDAVVTLNYDEELQMIITDHLQAEQPHLVGDFRYYIPDGTYEGFRWEQNKWRYVPNVFTTTQAEPPFEHPVNFRKRHRWYIPD